MGEILIVRSASFQQLDLNLPEIKKKFPNDEISILTHEHGVKLAEKYGYIKNIYVYNYKQGFSMLRKADSLKQKSFDKLIIPVTNVTGAGFGNVLSFALTIKAKEKYICNVISEIKKISNFNIIFNAVIRGIFKAFAGILTAISSIFLLPILLIKMLVNKSDR